MMRFRLLVIFCFTLLSTSHAQWSVGWNLDFQTLSRGLEAYEQQLFARAQRDLETALRKGEENSPALARYKAVVAAINLSNRDAEHLAELFLRDFPTHPLCAPLVLEMGNYHFTFRRYKQAAEWYYRVDAFQLKGDALQAYKFKYGYAAFSTESYPQAKELFNQVRQEKSAYSASAEYYYGHLAYSDSNYTVAQQSFEKLRTDEAFGPVVPYYLAQIYYQSNQDDKLLTEGQKLLENPNVIRAAEINRLVADAFYRKADYSQAATYLERYRDLGGRMSTAELYQLGYAYFRMQRYQLAMEHFNKILNAPEEIAQQAHYHLAECYLKTGDKARAMTAFQSAMKGPSAELKQDAEYNYVKLNYEITSPYQDAISAIQGYLHNHPNTVHKTEMNRYLANLYLTTQDYPKALTALRNTGLEGPELQAAFQKVSYFRGVELYNLSQWEAARSHFQQSLQYPINPSFVAQAHYWTAETDYRLGDFAGAIAGWEAFRTTPGTQEMSEFKTALYNLGYGYFRQKNWAQSAKYFRIYADDAAVNATKRADASARVADCYFLTRGYLTAIDYYDRVIKLKGSEEEYARFQQAICLGLAGKNEQKVGKLQDLIRLHPQSRFAVDGRYELGSTLLNMDRNEAALTAFQEFLQRHKDHSLVRQAQLKVGLIYRNQGNPQQAAAQFKKVVEQYPATPEANEAISFARLVYAEMGQMQAYVDWVEGIEFANVKRANLDSTLYLAAYDHYAMGNYSKGATELDAYRNRFTDGIFVRDALFYGADAYYRTEQWEQAKTRYELLTEYPALDQEALVRFRLGEVYRKNNQVQQAQAAYERVMSLGTDQNLSRYARLYLMRYAMESKNWNTAMPLAEQLLADEKAEPAWKQEAQLVRARGLWATQQEEQATDVYSTIYRTSQGAPLAEAGYHLALHLQHLANYEKSTAQVYELLEKAPNQNYWRDRALLVLAENFYQQDDPFQAKYTLDFLRENTTDQDVLAQANALQQRMDAPPPQESRGTPNGSGSAENTTTLEVGEGLLLELPDETEVPQEAEKK